MKTLKVLAFLLVSVFSFSLISCSDNDDDGDKTIKLPTKIHDTDEGKYLTFEYNEKNQITTCNQVGDFSYAGIVTYDGDKIVKSEITGSNRLNETLEYTYSNNTVFITKKGRENNYSYSVELDSKGRASVIKGWDGDDHEFRFTYDSNGNATEIASYNNNKLEHKDVYTFDDKRGAYRNVNAPQWFLYFVMDNPTLFNKNNPTSLTLYDGEGGVNHKETYTYEYTQEGYPASITTTYEEGTEKTTIEYLTKNTN